MDRPSIGAIGRPPEMPRYFFHVTGSEPFTDKEGVDLFDDDAAWAMAVSSCGELLRDLDGRLPDRCEITVQVNDRNIRPVATLRFNGQRRQKTMQDD